MELSLLGLCGRSVGGFLGPLKSLGTALPFEIKTRKISQWPNHLEWKSSQQPHRIMWIFPLVGYVGVLLGFGFLTLAIGDFLQSGVLARLLSILTIVTASGLYYLSELVEEHTVFTKKLLTRLIYGVIATQILLAVVDGFPILLSLLSVFSHSVYLGNLRHFPTVRLTDPILILSCGTAHQTCFSCTFKFHI